LYLVCQIFILMFNLCQIVSALLQRAIPTLFAVLFTAFFFQSVQAQDCVCTNCPQFMPDGFTGNFYIQIDNADNPTLGQNGQGVCGVRLTFDHEYLGDLQITLTSPGGQSVTLIGPVGFFGPTDFTTWDVLFLPCGDPVNPDPGFANQWNNNQPWGLFGNYSGSYYPAAGCLQNFNSGPVNGQWTLTVSDLQAVDVGNFYNYEIIFCDPSGIECVSCAANAGNLTQPDVTACEGAPALSLDLPPTYVSPNQPPPASDYSYTYVIGGAGGVIQGYEAVPDLTAYPPGNYTVCGMSYLTADEGDIPQPNGSLTITQLSTQLNSTQPPFCGKITSNCVNVTINPSPEDIEEFQTICAPQCYVFFNQNYCQTGTYVRNLTQNGCPYTATLHLTVLPKSTASISETICPGGCAQTPGFEYACDPGVYQETFMNEAGCDSTVTLTVSVMSVLANIAQPLPQITCNQPTVTIQGTGSTLGAGTTYQWTASNGGNIVGPATSINVNVNAPGDYQLLVCRTIGGVTCCDSTSATVTNDQSILDAPDAINGPAQICSGQTATFSIDPVPGATTYNWTVPPGVVITSGQNTVSINVNWNNTAGGDVCVTANNSCGPSAPTCLSISVLIPPVPTIPQGVAAVCAGDVENYSIAPVNGATSYNWSVSPPATIVSGQGTPNIVVNWGNAATGNVCLNITSACGTSQDVCLPVQISTVPAIPAVAGDTIFCAGATGAFSTPAVAGATGYDWTTPLNSSIISGQNTSSILVNFTGLPGGNVCVAATNGCGTGPQDCFPVIVEEMPEADAGADDAECGTTASLQAITSILGGTGTWVVVSGPGTASFDNPNSYATSVTVTEHGSYIFQWTETNGDCSDSDSVTVDFNEPPSAGLIDTDCDATNQNYIVSFPVVGGTPPFTISGGTITNGVFTSNPIPNGQSYAFLITDASNCVSPNITGTFNCNCATNAGQMSLQPLSACEGDTIVTQHLGGENLDPNDVAAFVLHNNSGPSLGQIFDQNASGIFSFQNGMSYGTTYYVSLVVGNNLNGVPDPDDPCLSVAQGQPVTFFQNPVSFAGVDADTCGLTLKLLAGAGNGTGEWATGTAPPGGTLTFSNPIDSASIVTASISGIYVLTWTVDEDGCTDTDEVQIQFNDSPTLADLERTCDATNQNFTVTLTFSGGTAPYSVNGNPVVGNTFVSQPFPNGQSYSFSISDANGCSTQPVNGAFSCNCVTDAGAMQSDTLKACEGTTVTVPANAVAPVLDGNDVTGYALHDGTGPALGQVFSQNTTGEFGFQTGMNYGQTYFISLIAGDNLNGLPDPADPCFSVAAGQPVVFLKNPQPDAGPDADVCAQTVSLQAVGSNFTGLWSQISGPATAVFSDPNDPGSGVNAANFGTYIFQWTETNEACVGTDSVTVTFNESPSVNALNEVCNGANTQFTVSFSVSGGVSPYTVSGMGGSFAGSNFSSVPLANNSTYTFTVTDANGCSSPAVSGSKNCNCATDAGSMQTSPLFFCAGTPATVTWNNDASLDADDIVQFVLHDQSGASLGNILATNAQPSFDLTGNLQTSVTYYVSAIAGNSLNGTVDLNDPCLSVAPGAPIQWKPLPTATLTGDATICEGDETVLTFVGSGVYPLQVLYSDGSANQNTLTINNSQPVILNISPTATAVFTLISVSDATAPTCSTSLNQMATVTVNQPVTAGFANEPLELCAGTTLTLQLINFLTDADPGGQWTETSSVPSLPGGFISQTGTFEAVGQPAGIYTFKYMLTAQPPCPNDEEVVTIKLLAPPVADAGENQAINCDQAAVLLGGANTSAGQAISYHWLLNSDTVGMTEQIFVSVAGDYTLLVTNSAGCSASDDVTVILDNDPPSAEIISVKNVSCYGEANGVISIDSVSTNHPPLLYALNNNAFDANSVFSGLDPGVYTVTILDANGCESTTSPLVVEEPAELKIELGTDVEAALGDSVYLSALTTVPLTALDTILWQPLFDSTAAGKNFQQFLPLQSWKVNVAVTDTNGCVARDEILVRVDRTRHVYIPNIFNPKSAQYPVLMVYGGQDVAEVEVFRIYDRWGEQLFEALDFQPDDPANGWTGTQRGKDVAPGVYVYYAVVRFLDGQEEIFTGDVTVFR